MPVGLFFFFFVTVTLRLTHQLFLKRRYPS
jgi:hypothetical protein